MNITHFGLFGSPGQVPKEGGFRDSRLGSMKMVCAKDSLFEYSDSLGVAEGSCKLRVLFQAPLCDI